MDSRNHVVVALFLALETAQVFSMVNPSIFTIRRFPDAQTAEDIRAGEIIASGIVLTTALAVSALLGSPAPFLIALAYVALFVAVYEYFGLRGPARATPAPIQGATG